MQDQLTPNEQKPTQSLARRRIGEVAEAVEQQIQEREQEQIDAAAFEEPAWDSSSATSNVGRRISARTQPALRRWN